MAHDSYGLELSTKLREVSPRFKAPTSPLVPSDLSGQASFNKEKAEGLSTVELREGCSQLYVICQVGGVTNVGMCL